MRVHSVEGAKENEERWEGISQAQPGYRFSHQVPPMSALFSTMRNEFILASRSLMPMQRPEKPAPTMRTSTLVTTEFTDGAARSVMRLSSLPCPTACAGHERAEMRRSREAIGEPRESGAGRAARRGERRAKFSVRRGHRQLVRARRGAWSRRAKLHPRQRE